MTAPLPAQGTPNLAELAGLARLASDLLDGSYGDDVSPEAVLWRRVTKVSEEAGEVQKALRGYLGENPRKGVTHTREDMIEELLDTAGAALGAVEHLVGADGTSVERLVALLRVKVARLAEACGATL